MTTADLHTLTGAYALHALGPEERAEFERHLLACPACAQEVAELSATATRLGLAVSLVPPDHLKQQVLQRVATERQLPPEVATSARPGAGARRRRALTRWALAACIAGAAALGGVAVWQHQEAQDARAQAQSVIQDSHNLAAVLSAPDARTTAGKLSDGATGTVVVSRSQDRAAFIASGLPTPPSGKTYQLWYDDAGTMRSAGLLNPSAASQAVLLTGHVGQASAMGITVEPAGGSAAPTTTPLALMKFPA
ncbi:anti-sigma factor [Streptomyces montanisoli]|uniref:Regulator of SigK n=1 Tax=Streptomyces montanisoli TaxID=2798581 RepID=A0A940MCE6_9ACTN|nr:anti-sigma factor [Streptomyces montanisoli]MBP0457430.1 anti-sigma factor [Streptomyces montanisoli]